MGLSEVSVLPGVCKLLCCSRMWLHKYILQWRCFDWSRFSFFWFWKQWLYMYGIHDYQRIAMSIAHQCSASEFVSIHHWCKQVIEEEEEEEVLPPTNTGYMDRLRNAMKEEKVKTPEPTPPPTPPPEPVKERVVKPKKPITKLIAPKARPKTPPPPSRSVEY